LANLAGAFSVALGVAIAKIVFIAVLEFIVSNGLHSAKSLEAHVSATPAVALASAVAAVTLYAEAVARLAANGRAAS
jgi:hypothetical protein